MKSARKIDSEKLMPVTWGYLEIRDDDISPCVAGIGAQLAQVATLSGLQETLDLGAYDVDWRIWDAMPNEWERIAAKWKQVAQTRMA